MKYDIKMINSIVTNIVSDIITHYNRINGLSDETDGLWAKSNIIDNELKKLHREVNELYKMVDKLHKELNELKVIHELDLKNVWIKIEKIKRS